MESPQKERKLVKKIVPLKGSLLQKLRSEFSKNVQKNPLNISKKTDDVQNNNNSQNVIPEVKQPLKSPENKIIIQKVEKVKLQIVSTDSKCPPRRISKLFAIDNPIVEPTVTEEADPVEILDTNEIQPAAVVADSSQDSDIPIEYSFTDNRLQPATVALFKTKMPENIFNKTVPLVVKRIMKQPAKLKPNFVRNRFRYEVHKTPDSSPLPPSKQDLIDEPIQCEKIEEKCEKIQMKVEQETELEKTNPSAKMRGSIHSDSENDFLGFNSEPELPDCIWFKVLEQERNRDLFQSSENQQKVYSKCVQLDASLEVDDASKSEEIGQELAQDVNPTDQIISQPLNIKPMPVTETEMRDEQIEKERPTLERTQKNPVKKPLKIKVQTRSVSEELATWKDDVLSVIGIARIREIDKSLKSIPNIVNGTAGDTENIELKLIISHLLQKCNAKSIEETIENTQTDFFHKVSGEDTSMDNFDDNSNFFTDTGHDDSMELPELKEFEITHNAYQELIDQPSTSDVPQAGPTRELSHDATDKPAAELEVKVLALAPNKPENSISRKRKNDSKITNLSEWKKMKSSSMKPLLKSKRNYMHNSDRQRSLQSSSRESSTEPKTSTPKVHKMSKNKLMTKKDQLNEPNDSENELYSSNIVRKRAPKVLPFSSDETDSECSEKDRKNTKNIKAESETDSDVPLTKKRWSRISSVKIENILDQKSQRHNQSNTNLSTNNGQARKSQRSKMFDSDSDSSEKRLKDLQTPPPRGIELKQRVQSSDSNSRPSSILIRNDYHKSPPSDKSKNTTAVSLAKSKLKTTLIHKKTTNLSYVSPPKILERAKLKTPAMKGNDECSNDNDIHSSSFSDDSFNTGKQSASSVPSPNRAISVTPTADTSIVLNNLDLNERMKQLIEKEKLKLSKKTPSTAVPKAAKSKPESIRGRARRNLNELSNIEKKIFVQEQLEKANESKVPYDEILEEIRVATLPKKCGPQSKKSSNFSEILQEIRTKLKALKYFLCGNCKNQVSKHKWGEHFEMHGGFAWLDSFEPALTFDDWNEVLRRTINNMKIYKLISLKCPNCDEEKKSALGHLSHMIICGESAEVIEQRKVKCDLCPERVLPSNLPFHKSKCLAKLKAPKIEIADSGDDDNHSEVEAEKNLELFDSSGRKKRKAVQRAEIRVKKMLNILNNPADHLRIINGIQTCRLCNRANFTSREHAIKHVKKAHDSSKNVINLEDASDSDASVQADDESTETECSSGVESSDFETADEDNFSEQSVTNRVSKVKISTYTDTAEVIRGRKLLASYVNSFRSRPITQLTPKWTRDYINSNWTDKVFMQMTPNISESVTTNSKDIKAFLSSLNFTLKSFKFGINLVKKYQPLFGTDNTRKWHQLEIGDVNSDGDSKIIYCGGSVASIDWAPMNIDDDGASYLAVACNSNKSGIGLNLTESSKSCIQIYQFNDLKNDKSKKIEQAGKLNYVIIVNDGPILSIKFHPCGSLSNTRIGLLAVSTSNQSVLIYSLPYLTSETSVVLPIEPNLICKLEEDDVLYQDKYLMQVSKVAWLHKNGEETLLAAGYIDGLVGVWNVSKHKDSDGNIVYPIKSFYPHSEVVTSLDFHSTENSQRYLMTASLDRRIKVFYMTTARFIEVSTFHSLSRILCGEWWMNWPSYLIGHDSCFTTVPLVFRSPLEFAMRNTGLLTFGQSITHMSVNNWTNSLIAVTDAGDVISFSGGQMMQHYSKDKWKHLKFHSYTDIISIAAVDDKSVPEIGIVFCDINSQENKGIQQFRLAPTDRTSEVQINQICFNRNEKSHRFYALAYETGFIRVKYLKR